MITFNKAQDLLRNVAEIEDRWLLHGGDKVHTSWMPFQPADFIAILSECVPEMKGSLFLDVGCGPGTKMSLAKALFGLDAVGIERDSDMVQAALRSSLGICVEHGDALESSQYHEYDLIWLYRPFKDRDLERQLEEKIFADMKPGAIVAGGAWEHKPDNWITVIDDWEIRRGAWKKP